MVTGVGGKLLLQAWGKTGGFYGAFCGAIAPQPVADVGLGQSCRGAANPGGLRATPSCFWRHAADHHNARVHKPSTRCPGQRND